eukprot:530764-Prorocentrum_minimum.AAC.4
MRTYPYFLRPIGRALMGCKWHLEGSADSTRLGRFFGVRKCSGEQSNSPVVEWLKEGLNVRVEP